MSVANKTRPFCQWNYFYTALKRPSPMRGDPFKNTLRATLLILGLKMPWELKMLLGIETLSNPFNLIILLPLKPETRLNKTGLNQIIIHFV